MDPQLLTDVVKLATCFFLTLLVYILYYYLFFKYLKWFDSKKD